MIGIDELDRIEPINRGHEFLNEVKAVFEVPGCLFVLSVSDEALQQADLARPGRRDAFDSAIDEVVRVAPLTYPDAVRFLDQRAIGIPEPFIALFHCLSGGSPRDLLRIARAVAIQLHPDQPRSLAEITQYLIDRDLDRGIDEPGDRDFHDTLREIFTNDLIQDHLRDAIDPAFAGSFDALATQRRRLAEPVASPDTITAIRRAWQLPEHDDIATD